MIEQKGLKYYIASLLGINLHNITDIKIISSLEVFEKCCALMTLIPRGFSHRTLVYPKFHRMRTLIANCIIYLNLIHVTILQFDLPDWMRYNLGDFFHDHPKRRIIWSVLFVLLSLCEILRQGFRAMESKDKLEFLSIYSASYSKGFTSQIFNMDRRALENFKYTVHILSVFWIRLLLVYFIAPILIFSLVFINNKILSQSLGTILSFFFWFIITHLGIALNFGAASLCGGLSTLILAYFFYRLNYVSRVCEQSTDKNLDKPEHFHEVVYLLTSFANEIEIVNIVLRNWLFSLYLGLSFASDVGFFVCFIVHIDRGLMEAFIGSTSAFTLFAIAICSFVNAGLLSKMVVDCKQLYRILRSRKLSTPLSVKIIYLIGRLASTDAALTIGEAIHMTKQNFILFVVENACMIMMLQVNLKSSTLSRLNII